MYDSPYYTAIQRRRIAGSASARPSSSMRATPAQPVDSSGFLSNLDAGQITSAITGVAGLTANTINMANQPLGIGTQAPGLEKSATGEPVYNVGEFYNQAALSQPQGATVGESFSGLATGAAAGALVGGVPGAIVGGVIGLGTSLFGGSRRKRKQRAEKRSALRSAKAAQETFNKGSQAFDQSEAARADYYKRLDTSDRLYNLYK